MKNPLTRNDVGTVAGFFQLTAILILAVPVALVVSVGGTFLLSFPVFYLDRLAASDPWGWGVLIGGGSLLLILIGCGLRFFPRKTYFDLREQYNGVHRTRI